MTNPVEVVGVYEVPDAPDALLIEVVAAELPKELDLGGFTQEDPGQPVDNWQVPWMEQWLDETGEHIVGEPFDPPPDDLASSRVVFFLHFVALDRPLMTPTGSVVLPKPAPLPSRLAGVEYEPVD
jgi:hypothetical protein